MMANRNLLVEIVLKKDVRNYKAGTILWAKKALGRPGRNGAFWNAVDPNDGSVFRVKNADAEKAYPGKPGSAENEGKP